MHMVKSKTCYIDVTQLVHWEGFVAGIPRVMYELSRRFKDDDTTSFIFVSWVKELGAFCEIDFHATLHAKKNGLGIQYSTNDKSTVKTAAISETIQTPTPQKLGIKSNTKLLTKKVIAKTGLKDTRILNKIKKSLYLRQIESYKKVVIKNGDTIFISWGEWWDENFLRVLESGVKNNGLSIVPIIHDVLPFTQTPHFSGHSTASLKEYCRRVVSISKLVLCVSQSTKNDLTSWYEMNNITIPHMEVFRLGEDFEFKAPVKPHDDAFTNSGLTGNDYMIVVGTVEAKKNHTLLYYVYKRAYEKGIELPKMVIVGRRGWKTENIIDFMQGDPQVKDKFVFLHNASDEELSWLYDNSLMSVFPSFAEGWGMPIAESIARGVPCACSNTTSMVEIAEDYVRHFSPTSPDECLNVITDMLSPTVLDEMRKKCLTYEQTTWDKSHDVVRGLMKEVVNV